jgi:hypothetical protein
VPSRRTSPDRSGGIALDIMFTYCAQCVYKCNCGIGRTVVIAGTVGKQSAGLIAPHYAAVNCLIPLVDGIIDVFPGKGAPAGAANQRLVHVPADQSRNLKSHTADTQRNRPATMRAQNTHHREMPPATPRNGL